MSMENVCSFRAASCLGSCVNGSCIDCPVGWEHEKSFFFLENCGQPSNLFIISPIIFILLLFIIFVYSSWRAYLSTGPMVKVLASNALTVFCLFIANIALLSQQFIGPAFLFFFAIATTSIMFTTQLLTWIQFEISFRTSQTPFPQEIVRKIFTASLIFHALPTILMFIAALLSPVELRNILIAIGTILEPSHQIFNAPISCYGIHRLIRTIRVTTGKAPREPGENGDKMPAVMKELIKKLRNYELGLYIQFPIEIIICSVVGILYLTLRLPMAGWTLYLLANIMFVLSTAALSVVSRSKQQSKGSAIKTASDVKDSNTMRPNSKDNQVAVSDSHNTNNIE